MISFTFILFKVTTIVIFYRHLLLCIQDRKYRSMPVYIYVLLQVLKFKKSTFVFDGEMAFRSSELFIFLEKWYLNSRVSIFFEACKKTLLKLLHLVTSCMYIIVFWLFLYFFTDTSFYLNSHCIIIKLWDTMWVKLGSVE